MTANPYRSLPGVDALVSAALSASGQAAQYSHARVVAAARVALAAARDSLRNGGAGPTMDQLLGKVLEQLTASVPGLHPVINATGVIIHTNLGRAPLSLSAQQAIQQAAATYTDLEFDLATGGRGKREAHLEAILAAVTGAEAALAVNNNAAATLLMLTALAQGREVILSRGQLVEIGGGFRVPDVMAQSGARLVEVGTTNRTRIADFERAITLQTALLLRVHSSNFKMIGFTEQPTLAELAALAHDRGLLAADDLGSGALLDTAPYGMEHEPTVAESLRAGFDVVAFSGDKLLGGPQAGIIVGKKAALDLIKRHPLARAVRIDKLSLAGLAATLDHYRYDEGLTAIPVWRMITMEAEVIRARAEGWVAQLGPAVPSAVVAAQSTVGGGSLPGETLPTWALAIATPSPDRMMDKLRSHLPPVIARIADGRVLFDPRTVFEGQDEGLLAAIRTSI
jgi:L-seryl-tRNA(Ser) seleniumtransferase